VKNAFVLLLVVGLMIAAPAPAQVTADVVTVGTGATQPGGTVDVPVFIRDVSGTPLGIDQPPGSRIQSFSIKVDYSPASAVQSITFSRGGITTALTPTFESSPSSAGTISLLDTFQESTNPIPFTLNAAAPGNQVAVLHVTVAPAATPGSTIVLALDPVLTQLTDQAGSAATKETVANTRLLLVNGLINISIPAPAIPTLSGWMLFLLAVTLSIVVFRTRL
jgi:hypothetical protein